MYRFLVHAWLSFENTIFVLTSDRAGNSGEGELLDIFVIKYIWGGKIPESLRRPANDEKNLDAYFLRWHMITTVLCVKR
jgi:hypothetical protein